MVLSLMVLRDRSPRWENNPRRAEELEITYVLGQEAFPWERGHLQVPS